MVVYSLKKKSILVHASNVTGLGASQVVGSLIRALKLKEKDMFVASPVDGALSTLNTAMCGFVWVRRILPNSLFRVLECLLPKLFYPSIENNLILGDIPLRGLKNQLVLVHQSNLIKPSVNCYSSKSMTFKIMRKIFEWNLKYVKYIIVQSEVMKEGLTQSYPELKGIIKVITQPAPNCSSRLEQKKLEYNGALTLFYPAAGYPHKNHLFIAALEKHGGMNDSVKELFLTLRDNEVVNVFPKDSKVHNVGLLPYYECINYYQSVDALFFPSTAESYGLPLLEAMQAGLPILCSDLPYARWMCGEEAIYFDPTDVESATTGIKELQARLKQGWRPDWTQALSKFPEDWDNVAQEFVELLE